MTTSVQFGRDDIFLLGNIAARAVSTGEGSNAETILKFVQLERPGNAGGHMLQAVYLFSAGRLDEAIEFLEDADIFNAEVNGPEVFAFYLILLKERGDTKRVRQEAAEYRAKHRTLSESARHAIDTILAEIAAEAQGSTINAV